jgi:hypothetical protein
MKQYYPHEVGACYQARGSQEAEHDASPGEKDEYTWGSGAAVVDGLIRAQSAVTNVREQGPFWSAQDCADEGHEKFR